MKLIKKIINWIINFFRSLFGKKNKKSSHRLKTNSNKKNKDFKVINTNLDISIPSYMIISMDDKEILISKIMEIKRQLSNTRNKEIKEEIGKIVDILTDDINRNNISSNKLDSIKKLINSHSYNQNKFELMISDFSISSKDKVSKIYSNIGNLEENLEHDIKRIDDIINLLNKKDLSIIESVEINSESERILDSNLMSHEKIDEYNKEVLSIVTDINKNIIHDVNLEYHRINYVTLSTKIIDDVIEKVNKIESEYASHLYNKYYYEREIKRIKKQINELMNLKNKSQVYNEITRLRKELYTKSKDKYDLLYNNEIFMNIDKKCDDLLNKVNAKVIDIKKEEVKQEKVDRRKEYLENIIKRFQDMDLARELILKREDLELDNDKSIIKYVNNIYSEFLYGETSDFNFEKNRTKTELVKFYNNINVAISYISKEKTVSIDHINFRMNDLVDAAIVKKDELENLIEKKYHFKVENSLVDDKLNTLNPNYKNESNKILKKTKKEENNKIRSE